MGMTQSSTATEFPANSPDAYVSTQFPPVRCADCGDDVNAAGNGALIVSTVIGRNVLEAIACTGRPACARGFLDRAAELLHAPVEIHGGGYAEVFADDTHFVKVTPSFGPILTQA